MGYKLKIYSRRFFAWIPVHEFSSATENPKAYWRNDRSVFCRTPSVCAFTEWTFAVLSSTLTNSQLTVLAWLNCAQSLFYTPACAPSLQGSSQLPVLFCKEKSQPEAVVTYVLFGVGGHRTAVWCMNWRSLGGPSCPGSLTDMGRTAVLG